MGADNIPNDDLYQQGWKRLLAIATQMTGDEQRADFLLRTEPLKAFDDKTAETLLKEGRTEDVIAYLESFAGGAAG